MVELLKKLISIIIVSYITHFPRTSHSVLTISPVPLTRSSPKAVQLSRCVVRHSLCSPLLPSLGEWCEYFYFSYVTTNNTCMY